MPIYKRSVDFLPKISEEEKKQKYAITTAGLYAALLPLLASIVWIIALLLSANFKSKVKAVEETIENQNAEIASYASIRQDYLNLVYKTETLSDIIRRDFYPQDFFDKINQTIRSTGDARAKIYAYSRDDDGTFQITGKADSYLDLAKLMVVFNNEVEFSDVEIDSIFYKEDEDDVNFEISFNYFKEEES